MVVFQGLELNNINARQVAVRSVELEGREHLRYQHTDNRLSDGQ